MHLPTVPVEDAGASGIVRHRSDSQTSGVSAATYVPRIDPNDARRSEVNVSEASRWGGAPIHALSLASDPATDPAADGLQRLRSVLYPGQEVRSNPLSAFKSAVASWAAEIALSESIGRTLVRWCSPLAYVAAAGGLAHSAWHGLMPRFQDLVLSVVGLVGLEGIDRGLERLASTATKAAADQVVLSPRRDSLGQDRTREVADLLDKILSHASTEAHRLNAVVGLVCAMGTFPGYSEALSDLAGAREPRVMKAALDAILADQNEPATRLVASALRPIHRDVRCMELCIDKRRSDTSDAIDRLMVSNPSFQRLMERHENSEPGKRGDSPLNDDAICAMVTEALGGRAPLSTDEGLVYGIARRMQSELRMSERDIVRECFREALGLLEPLDETRFDGWLDELTTEARQDLIHRAAATEARDAGPLR